MERSESPAALKAAEKLLVLGIPFNKSRGFKLLRLQSGSCAMKAPFKRSNKNHLGTMHACAIAALGEFPAGLLLIKNFSPVKHRVVMTKLEVEYHKHGSAELTGETVLPEAKKRQILAELDQKGQARVSMQTVVTRADGEKTADVTTQWQLKPWDSVKPH